METIWFGYCLKVWGQYVFFFYKLRARFTNSLRQCELSFGIKIVLSELTKDAQWRISTEKAWTVIFAPDLMEYLSDAKFMGGEYSNESRSEFY